MQILFILYNLISYIINLLITLFVLLIVIFVANRTYKINNNFNIYFTYNIIIIFITIVVDNNYCNIIIRYEIIY